METKMNLPDSVLCSVSRPGRYTGGEWNSIKKDWDSVEARFVLAYPDAYEIGMSNLGVAILYDILNRKTGVLAERVYAPWPDMATAMRKANIPLFSLESKRPLIDFDIIGFSLGYELGYTNVLNILDLAGIPVFAAERNDSHPLVIAGGSCTLNPEPMADFFDLFVIGEGEEVLEELLDAFLGWKKNGSGLKSELLQELVKIRGIYVPSLYRDEYDGDGHFVSTIPQTPRTPAAVERRILTRLLPSVTRPVVASIEVTHDRGVVEIQRGCTRGCRFCQASIVYRPVRERTVTEVIEAVDAIIDNCGYEEISLLSLSTSDYSGISELVTTLSEKYKGKHLNISLPSLRPDAFSVELAKAIQFERKTSLTFAPEAGTARLREVINKGITEDNLFDAIGFALECGWHSFKLYFMIGLPTESIEDVEGIVDLVQRVHQLKGSNGRKPNIKVNVSTFIPKAHTPFQWVAQNAENELAIKHEILKRGIRKTGSQLSWHDPKVSLIEGVMSRGDRRLGKVIHRAWQLGCLFDAWTDQFNFGKWTQSFDEFNIDPNHYTRERSVDEALPWGLIETGVSLDFLKREYAKAFKGEETPDCRFEKCVGCGLQRWDDGCRRKFQT